MQPISTALDELLASLLALLPDLIIAILIFIASLYGAGLLSRMVRSALERRKTDREISILMVHITRWSVITLAHVEIGQAVRCIVSVATARTSPWSRNRRLGRCGRRRRRLWWRDNGRGLGGRHTLCSIRKCSCGVQDDTAEDRV